jgi:subtilisin family serine protease
MFDRKVASDQAWAQLKEVYDRRSNPSAATAPAPPPIALWPEGALESAEAHPLYYFYRPEELLVEDAPANIDHFRDFARQNGFDDPVASGTYLLPVATEREDRYVEVPVSGKTLGVVHYRLPGANIPALVDELQRARVVAAPNHVFFGCQSWQLWPCGDPSAPTSAQMKATRPKGNGEGVTVAVVDSGLPTGWEMSVSDNPLVGYAECAQYPPAPGGPLEVEPFAWSAPATNLVYPQGHGAFVAGVVTQYAKNARIVSYRALDKDLSTDEWSLANQLLDVVTENKPPLIINLSLGTNTWRDIPPLGLAGLATWANARVDAPIVIAAAGNRHDYRPWYPAAEPWAISVGAAEATGNPNNPYEIAGFSDYGTRTSNPRFWVDVCALGVEVCSSYPYQRYVTAGGAALTFPRPGYALWSGTSFATPHVSGCAATLVSQMAPGTVTRASVLAALTAGRPIVADAAGHSIGHMVL